MAQIVTITNPLTGQPAQVDQLEHTAQQIDDAIARALPGGAIDLEKAPSGFGYGETQNIIFWDDEDGTKLEQVLEARFASASMREKVFRTSFVDFPICKVSGNGGFADIYADASNDSNGYPNGILVVYYARGGNVNGPSMATKQKINGIWYPWEYVNPPMILNEEYRTTERYLGKPVYAKAINLGAGPGSYEQISVAHNIANVSHIVDFGAELTVDGASALSMPYKIGNTNQGWVSATSQSIILYAGENTLTAYNQCTGWIKCTKTTD